MEIQHLDDGKNGRFFMLADGKEQAFMTYVHAGPGKFIIDHTVVMPANEGKGLGKQLVEAAVTFARENNYKIMPLCPFTKAVFDKAPEKYADVQF